MTAEGDVKKRILTGVLILIAALSVLKIKNDTDYHLLTDAVEKGDNVRLEFLLSCGANPDVIDGVALFDIFCEVTSFKMTPLQRACSKGDYTAAQTLILHGADVNYAPANAFYSPLIRAEWSENVENKVKIVKLLIACGADVNYSCNYGTVLSWLVSETDPENEAVDLEILDILIKNGANHDGIDHSCMRKACWFKLEGFIRFFIEKCDYSASGGEVISFYCKGGEPYSKDTLDYLLNLGADVYEKDSSGKNAIDYLREQDREDLAEYLIEKSEETTPTESIFPAL